MTVNAARADAIDAVRYAQSFRSSGIAGYSRPTEEELAKLEAEACLYSIRENRRQMLAATVGLGRSYASVEEAIEDAKKLAAWLGVEIE